MKYLIDTNALIWFMNGDESISVPILNKIKNESNDCYVSIASIWEIAIKCNIGKLKLNLDFNKIAGFLFDNDLAILPIEFNHLQMLLNLELFHRDPFDRIIIAQGISQNLTILTSDKQFKNYPVKCLW
jgi:PIN domain nuclease of toxin-antitoxin system